MEFQEFTGENVDLAINEACTKLQVPSYELDYEIINRESAGFLGFGKKPARIRARKKVVQEPVVQEKKVQHTRPEKQERAGRPAKKSFYENREPRERKENRPQAPVNEVKEVKTEPKEEAALKETVEGKAEIKKEPRKGERKPRQQKKNFDRKPKKEQPVSEIDEKKDLNKEQPVVKEPKPEPVKVIRSDEEIEKIKAVAEDFLQKVFKAMELPVDIEINYDRENNNLEAVFNGEDMGILIGKRGQTLDSLQYLTSLVVNKGESGYIRVKLDTENYRSRRKDTLENLAKNIAFRVKKTRKPVSLEPMNPYERRIIHSALQGNKFVETYSEGNEPYRHVVVTMKKNVREYGRDGRRRNYRENYRDRAKEPAAESVKEKTSEE